MKLLLIATVVTLWSFVLGWGSSDPSCSSCGFECQAACGTRHFRACCFNFQRRRRSPISHGQLTDNLYFDNEDAGKKNSQLGTGLEWGAPRVLRPLPMKSFAWSGDSGAPESPEEKNPSSEKGTRHNQRKGGRGELERIQGALELLTKFQNGI